jgi:hypothetical protein
MPVYNFSTTPLYVAEGQTVQFRYEAPDTFDTLEQVEIQIGELTVFWIIETRKEDFAPDPFDLQDINPAEIDVVYSYAETQEGPDAAPFGGGSSFNPLRTGEEIITISGLSDGTQAPITISSNVQNAADYAYRIRTDPAAVWGAWTTGDNKPAAQQFVSNGDQIQVRLKSSAAAADEKRVTVTVGTGEEEWRITTGAQPVNEPNPVPVFDPINELELNTQVYSNIVQILGLNTDALIQIDQGGELRISSSNATTTEVIGTAEYQVLSSGTAWAGSGTVSNGDYVQLRGTSSVASNADKIFSIDIGDGIGISAWNTRTGNGVNTIPDNFIFQDLVEVVPGTTNIASTVSFGPTAPQDPNAALIQGLTDGISVPVVLRAAETTAINPRIKVNGGSSGTFSNVSVQNGDYIQLIVDADPDLSVAPTTESVQVAINVGDRVITAWSVTNWFGPDETPAFVQPTNLQNQTPGGFGVLGPIGMTDFNTAITISTTSPVAYDSGGAATGEALGSEVLISINGDAAVAGPRTAQPDNTGNPVTVTFFIPQPGNADADPVEGLSHYSEFDISLGLAPTFTFRSFNYAVKPVPPSYQGVWYSNKNEFFDEAAYEAAGSPVANASSYYRASKLDGYSTGTVLPVTKESINGYGDLEERFPGFLECDGTAYNAADYPFLFDIIGTQYGFDTAGSEGEYNETNKEYTGTFRVPDYRNRRLTGAGIVDGNRGSSAFLEADVGSYEIPGSTGGWWYVSDVDVAGPDPLEQVITTPGSNTGTESIFFELGTPKTFGTETLATEVPFNVTGQVNATIGPVSEKTVQVPTHEHFVITGIPEDISGDPVIPWDTRAYYGTQGSGSRGPSSQGPDEPAVSRVSSWWRGMGALNAGVFDQELGRTFGPPQQVDDYLPLGPEGASTTASFGNYWSSPVGPIQNLSPRDSYFQVNSGSPTDAAVIDSKEALVRIDEYQNPNELLSHTHLLGTDVVGDPNLDFSYGNANSFGGLRAGLPNFSNVITVTFNQSDVAIELNEAEFSWNNSTRPIPTVAMDPKRKVPVLAPFHKIKYIIKAY